MDNDLNIECAALEASRTIGFMKFDSEACPPLRGVPSHRSSFGRGDDSGVGRVSRPKLLSLILMIRRVGTVANKRARPVPIFSMPRPAY